jgi:ABC-type antimicrobial peptide transport system permease subunit
MAAPIRKVVETCQPDAVVPKVEAMDMLIDRSLAGRQNNVMLLGLFSAIAMLLAAVGLYATMAYIVGRRTQEIGLRIALGATTADVRSMIVREGCVPGLAGILIGVVTALAGARVVSGLLYGVAPTDALTYAVSVSVLFAIMAVASYIPARRATAVDPLEALRYE